MKGIVLAGGTGSRLFPVTRALSKQLLPVFDKPMIYYPLATLMLAGVRDILIIANPGEIPLFRRLLGDGSQLGTRFTYAGQEEPRGIPDAFIIGEAHIGAEDVALILGDNIFHGPSFSDLLRGHAKKVEGCVVFGYSVRDPHRYGIAEADESGRLLTVEEKPVEPRSDRAITGLFYFDNDVMEISRRLEPSTRGELEIVDVIRNYVDRNAAKLVDLGRGFAWLDAGTHDSLMEAAQFVRALERQQGYRIACLEEVAMQMGYISPDECYQLGVGLGDSDYGRYVTESARLGGA